MILILFKKYLEGHLKKEKSKKMGCPLTEEEKEYFDKILQKEKERYRNAKLCGGLDEQGQYTALHHRNG